jgi:predicted phage terminase large subunit-like protein
MLALGRQIPGAQPRLTERMIVYPGGGWVQVKSADNPATLRGEGLDLVVVDETAHIPKFVEAWQQSLRPALSDRQGRAIFISTPRGFNWFWELYKKAETEADWASFQHPTWDNPFIEPEEIESAKKLPQLVFRQEYGAEFVQLAGALFRREWFQILQAVPNISYVRFWDLATSTKTSADFTVGVKTGLTNDASLIIADVVRGKWEWPQVVQIISQTALADGPGVVQGVETVGIQTGMYQTLMNEPALAGIAFRPVRVTKDKLTRALPWLARAEQRKVVLVQAEWNAAFLDEVCAFPEAQHDDQVDAVSGAVQMFVPQAEEEIVTYYDPVRISRF